MISERQPAVEAVAVPAPYRPRDGRRLRQLGAGIVALCAVFLLWTIVKPGSHYLAQFVDNLGEIVLIALTLPLAFSLRAEERRSGYRWAPALLGIGILCYVVGQIIWTYYQNILSQKPFPSVADFAYLAAYPFLMAGVLVLPARRLSGSARVRLGLDGLMIMTVVAMYSWYFVLGPTASNAGESALSRVVGSAYPLFDLVLLFSLLLLWGRLESPELRRAVGILTVAFLAVIFADSLFDYQNLQNTYAVPSPIDTAWPLGYMLIGLAAYALRKAFATPDWEAAAGRGDMLTQVTQAEHVPLWRALVPYALMPIAAGLVIYTLTEHPNRDLAIGVYLGAGVLVVLTVARQILTILENDQLRRQEELYIQEVGRVMSAAGDVEAGTFQPESLEEVAVRPDALGQLARVFQRMAREVKAREERLRRQVRELRIQIDHTQKEEEVKEITDSDFFRDLQAKAQAMRSRQQPGGK